jgi:hypothetical protein
MHSHTHELESLAARARRGDAAAGARLRQQLQPQLDRLVRCALRGGLAGTAVAHRAHAEAHRAAVPGESAEALARRVALRIGEAVGAGLGGGRPMAWAADTLVNA